MFNDEMEDTQIRLAEQGRSLRFIAPDIFHLKHPERHLERLAGGASVGCVGLVYHG
jgi:hypothetical protein